ncbi:LamG-like jellyroll fold domain-containing protein [Micromonospora sp. DT81.3]|uniref:LamG-like jellyroll fold domain-containing protein n=1 Tax=Actinomycetes TaxID=1760 RepID=UPI003CEEE6D2
MDHSHSSPSFAQFTRRDALIVGAYSTALAVGGLVAGPASPARAAVSPRLPGEIGRLNNQVSRHAGTVFDHIRVVIGGDNARLFIPHGIVPGSQNVPVLWLYHGAQSSDDALAGGFKSMGERAVDSGMLVICQNLGGTLYTHPVAKQHQVNGWDYLSGLYDIDSNFFRGTSHGGAMAAEVLATRLIPKVVGSYIVNGVYDIEKMYLSGTAQAKYSVGAAFGNNLSLIRANNPARHAGPAWAGTRMRVVYSTPDSSDTTTPPPIHAKALLATAGPYATEASARTHTLGHETPGFTDGDNQVTLERWMQEIAEPEPPSGPKLVAGWDFAEAAPPFASSVAGAAALAQGANSAARRVSTPFGWGVEFNGSTDYLRVARDRIGPLNIGATTGAVTIAAWVLSTDTNNAMIAGCWQEASTGGERAYGLFNDLPTFGGDDRVCMHVSATGGATPGYTSSKDVAVDPRKITRGVWQFHAGTYDGAQAVAYLNGTAEPFPSYTDSTGATYAKNPYAYADGINPAPIDFLVGAGLRSGAPLNLHKGVIAKLRVWNGALTAQAVRALYDAEKAALG